MGREVNPVQAGPETGRRGERVTEQGMASTDRRAREKAGVNERILGAARELFARNGHGRATMRQISQAAG